ncbi:histidine phosphatase superfamily [Chiua virens]|nr:histidine phosphatase superfamily [Chiua virens]
MPNISPFLTLLAASTSTINKTAPTFDLPQSLQQSWATYSPYFPVVKYVPPPAGCDIVQLERHGARYPTSGSGKSIEESVESIKNATAFNSPSLQFVKDYNYTLENNGYLVPFGAAQSFDAGQEHYVRYASLVSEEMLPFVRASGDERVVESALNWTAGEKFGQSAIRVSSLPCPTNLTSRQGNDTLNNYCPAANSSKAETGEWTDTFTPPIVDWINAAAPGANLTGSDIVNLMALCAFDTVTYETPSQWCDVFSAEEFTSYEYYGDVKDFYGNGYGNELGPVQGVGYINELLARLTDTPVQDETQTNHTLDDNPATFPLNRTFYADFTHDDQMISIFSAMGLFKQPLDLDPTQPDPLRTWIVSLMVPVLRKDDHGEAVVQHGWHAG